MLYFKNKCIVFYALVLLLTAAAKPAVATVASPPVITSVSSSVGIPDADSVIITGLRFNDTASRNVVYFGSVSATVLTATSTQLLVKVPAGAVYAPVTVLNLTTRLAGAYNNFFAPTYNNSCAIPGSNTFKPRVDIPLTGTVSPNNEPQHAAMGDMDGDGKPDLVVTTYDSLITGISAVFVYKNISTPGTIAYDAPVICTSGLGFNVKLADLDGDGKLDIIIAASGSAVISCIRNTTPQNGPLSFAPKADLHPLSGCPEIAVADFDGDGKLDIAGVSYSTSCVKVYRNRMTSIPSAAFPSNAFGNGTSFDSFAVGSFAASAPGSIYTADFDGDGKYDLVTANSGDNSITVLRNTSTIGTISFAPHVEYEHVGLPTEVIAADLDNDGKPEIIAADYYSAITCIYTNTATSGSIDASSFNRIDVPFVDSSYGLGVADLDGNGKTDIVITRGKANSISVLNNMHVSGALATTSFQVGNRYLTGSLTDPHGVCIGDIDGDLKPDVVTANFGAGSISIFKNVSTPASSPITGVDSVCMLSSITLTSSHCANARGYWSLTNGRATIIGGTGAADTSAVITGVSAGLDTVVYAVVSTYDTAYVSYVISVKALADTGSISGPAALCVASSVTLGETATGGLWSSSDTAIAAVDAVTGMVTGRAAGNVIIYYTNQSVSCGPMSASHAMTINPLPDAGTITGANGTCVGSSISLTASVAGGTWVNTHPEIATDAPAGVVNTITGVAIGGDTILYVVTSPTCGNDTAVKELGIIATATALPILGDTSVCVGDTIQLTNAAVGGSWSLNDETFAELVGTDGKITGLVSGHLFVQYTVNYGCGPILSELSFTVRPLPVAGTVSGAGYMCVGGQITLTSSGASDPGTWSSSNTAISTVDPATGVVTGLTPGVDTIYYNVTNSCGTVSAYLEDTVRAYPPVDSVMGAMSVCPGAILTLTTTGGGLTGTWASSDPTIATVAGGVVTALASGNTIISYTVSTYCGLVTDTAAINVYQVPAVTPVPDQDVCNGTLMSIPFTSSVPASTFAWNNSDTAIGLGTFGADDTLSFTAHNLGSIAITSAIIVTPTANGCIGISDTFSIIVQPTPVLTDTASRIICDSATFAYTPASLTPAVSFAWSRAAVTGIAEPANSDTGSISEVLHNTTGSPVVVTYIYTLTVNGCTNQQSINVTVNPRSVLTTSLTPPDMCSHTLFSYSPGASLPGTTFAWARPLVAGISNLAASGVDNPNEVLYNTTSGTVAIPYTFTLSLGGCSYNQVVTVNVKPKTSLTGALADTVCSGTPFTYTANATLAGTTYAWTRASVTGISPASGSGTNTINDTLINSTFNRLNAVYVFTLTANACNYVEQLVLTVDPLPAPAPVISVHSPSAVCANTLYQNFGTTAAPADTAVQYIWTATGATVYATGSSDQYSLVNFPDAGNAVVTVTANVKGIGCYLRDTFAVTVSSSRADNPTVLYFNNSQFICLPSDEDHYQWGYDDLQLDSTILTGEINQDYINTAPDFLNKYYWVMTTRGGCTQKTYYKAPTGVVDVNAQVIGMNLFPNPASDLLTIEVSGQAAPGGVIEVYDMVGRKVSTTQINNNKAVVSVSALASGSYIVGYYNKGIKLASARFIKN
jgi:uncharacterized protein YjdB